MGFVFVKLPVLIFFQVGQGQILKKQIEIFIFRNLEDEFILTFAVLAGLALSTAGTAATALRTFDAVVLNKVIVTGMDAMAQAASPLMKHRFTDVIGWNGDRFAAVDVGHRAFVDGLGDRLFNLRFITTQEALAIHRALVFAVKTPVNEPGHSSPVLHLPTCMLSAR
ncbi:hypothetical protein ENTCAN_05724 [Enterobacter cancerogenus ATCC 35316]|nr:hypothetical protein ENTCAN_05724 [Enterobacter cancerogenus ATCC 35316]